LHYEDCECNEKRSFNGHFDDVDQNAENDECNDDRAQNYGNTHDACSN
jgi:hypothetical protein